MKKKTSIGMDLATEKKIARLNKLNLNMEKIKAYLKGKNCAVLKLIIARDLELKQTEVTRACRELRRNKLIGFAIVQASDHSKKTYWRLR